MKPLTLGPEGGRPGKPTQAVKHTCSGNFKILNCTTSAKIHRKNVLWQENAPPPPLANAALKGGRPGKPTQAVKHTCIRKF